MAGSLIATASLLLLGFPGDANAATAPVNCGPGATGPTSVEAIWKEMCEREQQRYGEELAAETAAAKEAADQAAKQAREAAPVTGLKVSVDSQPGFSWRHPGYTVVVARATPWFPLVTDVQIIGDYGLRQPELDETGAPYEGEGGTYDATVVWSCLHLGRTIKYRVETQGGSGGLLSHAPCRAFQDSAERSLVCGGAPTRNRRCRAAGDARSRRAEALDQTI
jgi:hypothetical protein